MLQQMKRPIARRLGMGVLAVAGIVGTGAGLAVPSPDPVQGRLTLQWGDPHPVGMLQAQPAPKLQVVLAADDGRLYPLDAAQSRRAADDLYALANRRVAVAFAPGKRMRQGARIEHVPDAIIPLDSQPPAKAGELKGNTRWVTVMCKFADITTEQKNLAFFNNQYGNAVGQLGHYWNEVSYGQIDLAGSTAHGWFLLPQPRSAYVTMVDGKPDADLAKLSQDCATAADAQVDFNGVQGVNMMFNGDLDGYAWGGSSCPTVEGSQRCMRLTWNPPWSFNNLAPLAHEMGHGYGLAHSDNSDGDSDVYDNPWDVMSDAWHNAMNDGTYGARPKHINMHQRDRLGWVDASRKLVVPAGTAGIWKVDLQYASLAAAGGRQLVMLTMPAQNAAGANHYTLESRQRSGDYEGALAGNAVIIHRVNGTMAYSQDASVPPATLSNNEGSMFKPGESWIAPDGAYRVQIDAATPQGFQVTIMAGQLTGGDQPALPGSSTRVAPAAQAAPVPAFRRSPATRRPPRLDARPVR